MPNILNIQHNALIKPNRLNSLVMKDSVNILHVNIRSIHNKFSQFELFLAHLDVNFSIIVISESWLGEYSYINKFALKNYHLLCSSRPEEGGGGVCMYVADGLEARVLASTLAGAESVLASVHSSGRRIFTVLAVYRAPAGALSPFLEDLGALVRTLPPDTIIIGDINIDLNPDNILDMNSFNYENLLTSYGFFNTILSPTRLGKTKTSLIDHIATNRVGYNIKSATIDYDISDHLPIFASIIFGSHDPSNSKLSAFIIDYGELAIRVAEQDWRAIMDCSDVNKSFELFTLTFQNLIKLAGKEKLVSTNSKKNTFLKPWMNNHLLKQINKRRKLHIKCKKEPFNTSLHTFYHSFRNSVTSEIKIAKTNYYKNEFKKCKNNENEKWKFINKLLNKDSKKSDSPTSLVKHGKLLTDSQEIADTLNDHFSEIGNNLADELPKSDIHFSRFMNCCVANIDFSFQEIDSYQTLQIIDSFTLPKATGYDNISLRALKENKLVLIPILTHLINIVIQKSSFPDCLKIARVTPLFKKGNKSDPTNYRPISILPALSKILEKCLSIQIQNYLELNNILSPKQFGFRKGKSTTGAINCLMEFLYTNFDQSKITQGVFLDFSKAFDTINHEILIAKLFYYNFTSMSSNLIQSYLQNRFQFIKTDVACSQRKPITIGVPQGSILGPLLFLIFINDLVNSAPALDCILFADDTNVFSTDNVKLQGELNIINDWCLSNRLILNNSKTFQVIFKNPSKISQSQNLCLSLNNSQLQIKDSAQFLGITLDNNLTFSKHIQGLVRKLNYILLVLRFIRPYVDETTMINLYYSFFYSRLIYGIEFWGHGNKTDLNKIYILQKKAIRIILNIKPFQTVSKYFIILKIMPLEILFHYRLLMFLMKSFSEEELKNFMIDHCQDTRLKSENKLKTKKFGSSKGQRSIFFSAIKLYNTFLSDCASESLGILKERLMERLWASWDCPQ